MRIFYYLVAVFSLLTSFETIAQSLTIGTSTTAQYFYGPYYRSSAASTINYSKYAYLYTPDELATIPVGSTITMIEWQKAAGTITAPNQFQIYLENNAATGLTAGTTWGTFTSTATNVYNNAAQGFTVTGPGWEGFTLSSGFVYTGGSLQILTDFFKQGTASGANTYYYNNTPGKALGWAATTAGTTATPLGTTTYGNNRPNIRITYTLPPTCLGTPDGGNAVTSNASICPDVNFVVQLNNASQGDGITYQWQVSTNGTTYTNIAGATTPSLTTSQNVNSFYQCVVTCGPSGLSGTSTPVQVTTNPFMQCYCTSTATNVANEEIFNVTVGSLNNTSTCGTTGAAGSTLNLYSNYTSVAAPNLAATATYSLGLTVGTCGTINNNMSKVFIDYNQNGLFTDAGELVYVSPAAVVGANTINASFVVPASAVVGLTRMRVINMQTISATTINPCGTYAFGETEDYMVNITPAPTCPQPTALTFVDATNTTATLQWTVNGSETQWEIEYGPTGFTPGTGTGVLVSSNPATINGLTSNSFYQAYIRAVCTPGDSSFYTGLVSFNTYNQGAFVDFDNSCPSTGFVDISTTGTPLPLNDEDEAPLSFPYTVFFQGVPYTNATIGNNGAIVFGTTTAQVALTNTAMTAAANGLYPFWDDLAGTGGGLWYQTVGTAPNRKTIVEWQKDRVGAAGNPVNFELIIEEATQEIYFVYQDAITGSLAYDNGASATIGLAGTNQDVQVSFNQATYLADNTCVHFVYTDCPKPVNLVANTVLSDAADFSWSAGLSGETNWTVVYGPAGFDPLTSGTSVPTLNTNIQLTGLDQLTQYDIYVFADCSVGNQSLGLFGTFFTPPFCSNPTAMNNATATGSILASWTWSASSVNYPATGFNVQYGVNGFDLYTGTVASSGSALNNIINDATLLSGGVYQVYVQAVCGTDTSAYVGPFSVIMPLANDSVCDAQLLNVDGTVYTFNNTGATVQLNEDLIAPPATGLQTTTGWVDSTLNLTTWFKFVAPASGNVRINNTAITYNGQAAVYSATTCTEFSAFTLIAANDNAIGGITSSPNFTVCGLTPGDTYYLMHDGGSYIPGNYSISISPINLNAGAFNGVIDVCSGGTANLFDGVTGYSVGGVWTAELLISGAGLTDSLFSSAGLAYSVFNFEYSITDGCAEDTAIAQVHIFGPSSAGNDGTVTVCRNEPFDLLTGLSGNMDAGGTWYNPSNQVTVSFINAPNIPGQYNYDYITGNGVCPNDTSNVLVSVNPNCDYNGLDELGSENFKVYPNPTSGTVFITNEQSSEMYLYEVTDMNGRLMYTSTIAVAGSSVTEINLVQAQPGMYFLRAFNDRSSKVFQIVLN